MATTTNYLQGMKTALATAAAQKKAALQNALNAATTTKFNTDGTFTHSITPGALDSAYMAQTANISDSNEASGTLRSGQRLKQDVNALTGYKSSVIGAVAKNTADQNAVDTTLEYDKAKLDAEYGSIPDLNTDVPVPNPTPGVNTPSTPGSPGTPGTPSTPGTSGGSKAPATPDYGFGYAGLTGVPVPTPAKTNTDTANLAKFYDGLAKQDKAARDKALKDAMAKTKTAASNTNTIGKNAKDRK